METNGHKEAQAWCHDCANATAFLTRLPIPAAWQDHSRRLAQSARAFPVAGLLIGALTALALYGARGLGLAPFLAAALALAATVLITGGLHEDGLADTADGFGGGRSRERKLEIMRDSRIGTYGVLALVLALMLKTFALAELTWQPVIFAAIISRTAMVWLMWSTPNARSDGVSALAGRPDRVALIQAMIVAAMATGLMMVLSESPQLIVVTTIICVAIAAALRRLALRQIHGQTGDVCGALQVLTETAMLVALTA